MVYVCTRVLVRLINHMTFAIHTRTQASAGYSQLAEWSKRIEKLKEEIGTKEERWMELLELAESV